MAWVNLGVAAIGVAGKVAMDSGNTKGGGGSAIPGITQSGDIYATNDHSGWVVNFGNGSSVGAGGPSLPDLMILAGLAMLVLKK